MTLDKKIEIIERYEAGIKCATIARERGIADSSVRDIIKRKDEFLAAARSSHLPLDTVVSRVS